MTTIVYNHKDKEIAVDSRETRGTLIASDTTNKIQINGPYTFALSGCVNSINAVVESYPNKPRIDDTVYGFMVKNSICHWLVCTPESMETYQQNYNEAAGSGEAYALTALDMGATAKEAVEMAAKRDSMTGGKIRVIKV